MPPEPSTADFNAWIPELALWNNGAGIDVDSWISCVGSHQHAAAYARLFWPEFVLHEDCVLFAGFRKEDFGGFMESTRGDRKATEAVMNHRHITDLFPYSKPEPPRELLIYVGRMLKEMWSAKLRRDFPDRPIHVDFFEDAREDLDFEITVYQEHRRP